MDAYDAYCPKCDTLLGSVTDVDPDILFGRWTCDCTPNGFVNVELSNIMKREV